MGFRGKPPQGVLIRGETGTGSAGLTPLLSCVDNQSIAALFLCCRNEGGFESQRLKETVKPPWKHILWHLSVSCWIKSQNEFACDRVPSETDPFQHVFCIRRLFVSVAERSRADEWELGTFQSCCLCFLFSRCFLSSRLPADLRIRSGEVYSERREWCTPSVKLSPSWVICFLLGCSGRPLKKGWLLLLNILRKTCSYPMFAKYLAKNDHKNGSNLKY